jgi:hypothetical protein
MMINNASKDRNEITLCASVGTEEDTFISLVRRYLEYFDISRIIIFITDKSKYDKDTVMNDITRFTGKKPAFMEIRIHPSSYEENAKLDVRDCDVIDVTGGTKHMASVLSLKAGEKGKPISYLEGPGLFNSPYPEVPRHLEKLNTYGLELVFKKPYVDKDQLRKISKVPSPLNFQVTHEAKTTISSSYLRSLSQILNHYNGEVTLQLLKRGQLMTSIGLNESKTSNITAMLHDNDDENLNEAKNLFETMIKDIQESFKTDYKADIASLRDELGRLVGLKDFKFIEVTENGEREVNLNDFNDKLLVDTNFFYNVDVYRLIWEIGSPKLIVIKCIREELINKVSNFNYSNPHNYVTVLAYHQYLSSLGISEEVETRGVGNYCDPLIKNYYSEYKYSDMALVSNDRDVGNYVLNINEKKSYLRVFRVKDNGMVSTSRIRGIGSYALLRTLGVYAFMLGANIEIRGSGQSHETVTLRNDVKYEKGKSPNIDTIFREMFSVIVA